MRVRLLRLTSLGITGGCLPVADNHHLHPPSDLHGCWTSWHGQRLIWNARHATRSSEQHPSKSYQPHTQHLRQLAGMKPRIMHPILSHTHTHIVDDPSAPVELFTTCSVSPHTLMVSTLRTTSLSKPWSDMRAALSSLAMRQCRWGGMNTLEAGEEEGGGRERNSMHTELVRLSMNCGGTEWQGACSATLIPHSRFRIQGVDGHMYLYRNVTEWASSSGG